MESPLTLGLRRLKTGALLAIISDVLLLIMIVAALSLLPALTAFLPGAHPPGAHPAQALGALVAAATAMGLLGLVAAVLLVICYVLWFMASGSLRRHSPKFGIGRVGMILVLAGIVLAIVATIALIAAVVGIAAQVAPGPPFDFEQLLSGIIGAAFGALAILAVATVAFLVGHVLFGVMIIRLPEEPGVDKGFRIAGALYIASAVLSALAYAGGIGPWAWVPVTAGAVLFFVSYILIYVFSKSSLSALAKPQAPSPGSY